MQGQFLVMNMDEEIFLQWLGDNCPMLKADHKNDVFTCLKQWCENNL